VCDRTVLIFVDALEHAVDDSRSVPSSNREVVIVGSFKKPLGPSKEREDAC
jgi:hypothetical protein